MDDMVLEEFTDGVNDYWGGECPDGWDDSKRRNNTPYLMGWYMASMWEVYPGQLLNRAGYPLQDED